MSSTFPLISSLHFQCKIDLQKNVLHIGSTGTETPFLPENELPSHSRLTFNGTEEEEAAAYKSSMDELEAIELRKAIEKSKSDQGKSIAG